MVEMLNPYKILVIKLHGKKMLCMSTNKLEYNSKIDFKNRVCDYGLDRTGSGYGQV
jgi:hypothetical protein